MLNPLSLPFALLGAAGRLAGDISRGVDALEQAVAQAAGLNELGIEALKRMDQLNERADLVLQELAEARSTFAEAMVKVDRLGDQGERVLETAGHAREQLASAQAELARATDLVQRAVEMAEPLDRMTTRAQKIAGSLRRGEPGSQ